MQDKNKTKDQLINELVELRKQNATYKFNEAKNTAEFGSKNDDIIKLNALVKNSPTIIRTCNISKDFKTTYISQNVKIQLGFEAYQFTENSNFWLDHIHLDDKNRVLDGFKHLYTNKKHIHEYRFQCKNGLYSWIHEELYLLCM